MPIDQRSGDFLRTCLSFAGSSRMLKHMWSSSAGYGSVRKSKHLNPEQRINLLISQGPLSLHVCFLSKITWQLYFSNKSCKHLDLLSGVSLTNLYSINTFSFAPCLTANICFALSLDTGVFFFIKAIRHSNGSFIILLCPAFCITAGNQHFTVKGPLL